MLGLQPARRADVGVEAFVHEIKFTTGTTRTPILLQWLKGCCLPEQPAPHGIVSSIYYDTSDLALLAEKDNSDYLKTKVRVRWYSDPSGRLPPGRAFLEIKRRVGNRREKHRIDTECDGGWLSSASLDDPAVVTLPERLRPAGLMFPPLLPVLTVRYERYRFVEPASGVRVSVDTAIGAAGVSRRVSRRPPLGCLTTTVLEIKGLSTGLPDTLRPLAGMGVRKGSFSKYLACFEYVTRRVL
jgi:hypothetical protein